MGDRRARREFRRESFACSRDWVHFIVEFELVPCASCRSRARIRPGAPPEWCCAACTAAGAGLGGRDLPPALPLHPDLWRALAHGEESSTACPLCRQRVPLSRCWISPDARRLYCASHLRPISSEDRLRRADRFLGETEREASPSLRAAAAPERPPASFAISPGCGPAAAHRSAPLAPTPDRPPAPRPPVDLRLLRLAAHLRGDRCARCPFNGAAVYHGSRLVEVDPDRRHCTSAPDALNCAGIEH